MLVKSASGQTVRESSYTYDPFDRRIGVRVDPDGAGSQAAQQTWTVYDGANPYADFNAAGSRTDRYRRARAAVVCCNPDRRDFNGAGALTDRYLYGAAVDQILADLEADGDLYWYLSDHLGSVRDLADSTATVVDHIRYDSFGRVLSESNATIGDRFKYTGREYDAATGLYYYRARYYDPATGRFLSQDPIAFAAGDANLYRYVGNRPASASDPSGLVAQYPGAPPDFDYAAYALAMYAGYTNSGGFGYVPPPPVTNWGGVIYDGIDAFFAGYANSITFGYSNYLREQI